MIAITGINGFIGGYLYSYLVNRLWSICGLSTNPQRDNIIKLVDGIPQQNYIKGLRQVIHCGGLIGAGFQKTEYVYANVNCTRNLLNWCEKRDVEHFIFFSSGAVYGPRQDWVDENANLNPLNEYARSKLIAEELVSKSSIPLKTIIRLYFPIGGLRDKHVFSRIASNIRTGKPVFINNPEGSPRISPISIYDLCRITEQLLIGKLSGIYNLSSNLGISMGEIIKVIAGFYGVQPIIDVNNTGDESYLGISGKIIASTGYEKFITPQSALNYLLAGKEMSVDKGMEN